MSTEISISKTLDFIKPLEDMVVIEEIKTNPVTKGGILLTTPEVTENFAVVVRVGDKVSKVRPGDKVIFDNFSGSTLSYFEKGARLISEDRIFAIIEE